jgi:hypothetical protein
MQPQTPAAPPLPPLPAIAPPSDPVIASGQVTGVGLPGGASPADIFQAFRAQRRELGRQLESLEEKRGELRRELQQELSGEPAGSVSKAGLEARIADIDQRIAALDKQIAAADQSVAQAAAIPGAAVQQPEPPRSGPPEEAFVLGGIFIVVVLLPISIAFARRIWRRSAQVLAELPRELGERLTRLEQAIDAIAVEVERVGEGQRYVTRQMNESAQRALGAGAAEPVEVKQREAIRQEIRR